MVDGPDVNRNQELALTGGESSVGRGFGGPGLLDSKKPLIVQIAVPRYSWKLIWSVG